MNPGMRDRRGYGLAPGGYVRGMKTRRIMISGPAA